MHLEYCMLCLTERGKRIWLGGQERKVNNIILTLIERLLPMCGIS